MKLLDDIDRRIGSAFGLRGRGIDLAGRCAFITGGSRGLGLELARVFGGRGARVAIFARDPGEVNARGRPAARGIDALALPATCATNAVERALDAARARFGEIDMLVNNAGMIEVGPLRCDDARRLSRPRWTRTFGDRCMRSMPCLPAMRARRDGRIVNVSSIGGRMSVPHLLPYSASKFALAGYSEGLRAELSRERVVRDDGDSRLDAHRAAPRTREFKGRASRRISRGSASAIRCRS